MASQTAIGTTLDDPSYAKVIQRQGYAYHAFNTSPADRHPNSVHRVRYQLPHFVFAMANNLAQPPQAFPIGFEEIEGLVKTLSDPGHAKKIPETEATLRVLQRSPQGWEIGDALLHSSDENVRFFGALTFTVKLNADS